MKAFYILIISYLLFGCKTESFNTFNNSAKKELPNKFHLAKDSATTSTLPYQKIFRDSLLVNLIDTALERNLDLKIALQRIEISKAQLLANKGKLFPYISGNASAGVTKFGKYTSDGVGNYDVQYSTNISKAEIVPQVLPDYFVGLQASWEVDIWKKLTDAKKSSYYKLLASQEFKNYSVSSLVAIVADLYFELQALDFELEIVKQTVELQTKQQEIIELEKQSGRANELAVQQFEAQALNFKTIETELKQRIIIIENTLNTLMVHYDKPVKRTYTKYLDNEIIESQVGIPTDLLQNRPDIRQAEMNLQALNFNVNAARKAFYPKLNITGLAGFQTFNFKYLIDPASVTYNLVGGLVAPLINRSAIKSDFKMAKAMQLEALYEYQKTILNAYREVNTQIAILNNLSTAFELKQKEVNKLSDAIVTVSELYQRGRATYLEILYTRKSAFLANIELIQIKKKQYEASVLLYKALGGGWK
ncbi:MAG: TolC family protein [Cytophagales bacterium]